MNQTWENGKKPNFGPVFCQFFFFMGFATTGYQTLCQIIIVIYLSKTYDSN